MYGRVKPQPLDVATLDVEPHDVATLDAREHVVTTVAVRMHFCTCGAVLMDVPDEMPFPGPRAITPEEHAAHAAHLGYAA